MAFFVRGVVDRFDVFFALPAGFDGALVAFLGVPTFTTYAL